MSQPPTCPTHPHVTLLCPACIGGQAKGKTSARKAETSAQNAAKARLTRATRRREG